MSEEDWECPECGAWTDDGSRCCLDGPNSEEVEALRTRVAELETEVDRIKGGALVKVFKDRIEEYKSEVARLRDDACTGPDCGKPSLDGAERDALTTTVERLTAVLRRIANGGPYKHGGPGFEARAALKGWKVL
jgi:hypothetical protein